MTRRLRSELVALVLHTSEADWAIVYQAHLPSFGGASHLYLFHRPRGAAKYHPQHEHEPADVRKARGLRRLIRYVLGHDIDYRQGDPNTFSLSWLPVTDLIQLNGARYFVDRCLELTRESWEPEELKEILEYLNDVANQLARMFWYSDPRENDLSAIAELRIEIEALRTLLADQ